MNPFPGFQINHRWRVFHCFLPKKSVAKPFSQAEVDKNFEWFKASDLPFFKLYIPYPHQEADTAIRIQQGRAISSNRWVMAQINLDLMDAEWLDAHPSECILYDDGTRARFPSIASKIWRESQAKALRSTIGQLQEAFGDRLIGVKPVAGQLGEWNPWGEPDFQDKRFRCSDWCEPMLAAWREWTDDPLATPPSRRERMAAEIGEFREPVKAERVAQWYQCVSRQIAEAMGHFARVAREAASSNCAIGSHGGGWLDVGLHTMLHAQIPAAMAGSEVIRKSPTVNFLCTPHTYIGRDFAVGDINYMTPTESQHLHGVLHIDEADDRTHLEPHLSGEALIHSYWNRGAPTNSWETQQILKRNAAEAIVRRSGIWWYDIFAGAYDDPSLLSLLGQLHRIAQAMIERHTWQPAQVAFIIDGKSCLYQAAGSSLLYQLLYRSRLDFWNRAGITWDCYELADFVSGAVPPQYEAFVFLNAWRLTAFERTELRKKVDAATAKLIIWCVAPGYQADQQLSLQAVEELTGFHVLRENTICDSSILFQDGLLTASDLGKDTHDFTLSIIFHVAPQRGDEVLATWDSLGLPAVAQRGREVYWATPLFHATLLREISRSAGLHIYSESDDAIRHRDGFFAITAKQAGDKQLCLKSSADWVDLETEETLACNANKLQIKLQRGETRLLSCKESAAEPPAFPCVPTLI